MTLKSNFTYAVPLASVWGWADGLGNEYALVGAQNGLSIVDVTNPFSPVQVQFVATQSSNWHEIKTWQHYAYVVNESGGGTLIVDLSGLPGTVTYVYDTFAPYLPDSSGHIISDAHTLSIDENGFMWLSGGQSSVGALAFDLNTDPMNPELVALNTVYGPNYIHDCYVRNNKMYTADIYAGLTRIFDVTDKNNPVLLATQNTPWNFTHNSWLSDNSNVLFVTDEVAGSYVTAFDISNLSNIEVLDLFTGNPGTNSVPHNVHVRNDYLVIAHYRDGVVLADAHRPTNIIKIGNYDTYSQGSGSGFNGCWGVYPYLPSGNILASDITNGLFVLGAAYGRASYLEGTVVDSTTGLPLSGVTVTILSAPGAQSTVTSITGAYATGSAAAGTYSVQFSKTGYVTRTLSAVLTTANVTVLNTVLGEVQPPPVCAAPTTLNAINITNNSATLTWNNVGAASYLVTWRKQVGGGASSATTTATSHNISGLQSCKGYKFQVRATCPGGANYTSVWKNFSTTGSHCRILDENSSDDIFAPWFFPTPFNSEIQFNLFLETDSYVQVDLMDLTGKLVKHLVEQNMQQGKNTVQIETGILSPGIYIARTVAGEKNYYTKLVKQ
ncbi:MAG: choice-of-anchor B family protein [Bacteroidia bacterium]|nr:choice-of-anchor B family protein [Bacteroidia bacterium]